MRTTVQSEWVRRKTTARMQPSKNIGANCASSAGTVVTFRRIHQPGACIEGEETRATQQAEWDLETQDAQQKRIESSNSSTTTAPLNPPSQKEVSEKRDGSGVLATRRQ